MRNSFIRLVSAFYGDMIAQQPPLVGDQTTLDDLVLHFQKKLFPLFVPELEDEADDVAAVHLTGMDRHFAGQVGRRRHLDAVSFDGLVVD
jgi:hypothetical protein